MKLYLIRHGETDYTIQKRYCGFSNPPLNQLGKKSVESLNTILPITIFHKIIASDLQRTIDTANILFPNYNIIQDRNFREMNFGDFEGYDYISLSEKYPDLYQNWIYDPMGVEVPNAESFIDFKERILNAFPNIFCANEDCNVVLVTHSGVIRIIICEMMVKIGKLKPDYSLEQMWSVKIEPASLSIIDSPDTNNPKIIGINLKIKKDEEL